MIPDIDAVGDPGIVECEIFNLREISSNKGINN